MRRLATVLLVFGVALLLSWLLWIAKSPAPGPPACRQQLQAASNGQSQEDEIVRAPARWRVSMITGTPAKFIDFALAPDAETAEKQVAEEHEIKETLRHRLVAIREDL
jgi:hypothetical protein